MPISFDAIPAQWRMPLFWAEVDPSMAGLPIIRQPILIVGSMIADPTDTTIYPTPDPPLPAGVTPGIAVPNVPKPIGTQAQADVQYGQGSEIASMFAAAFANNFAHEIWALPVAPLANSTAASAKVTFLTPPTEAGMVRLYIGGHYVGIAVGTTDTTTTMATELAAAINDDKTLQVVATTTGPDVTITAKTRGKNGDDITLQLNYYGKIGGQELPPGLTMTVPPTLGTGTGGVVGGGVPDYSNAIANLGEHEYEYVALPYTDSNTLFDFSQEWGFSDTGRWGWMRQLYGHLFAAMRDDFSDLVVWGDAAAGGVSPNFGPLAVMAVEMMSPTPTWEWAAAYAAKAARALTNDPARPLQTLSLNKVLSAHPEDSFILPELNTLSGVGFSTQKRGSDGQPMIMRDTTTYQLNLYSQSDDAYELVTTMATLARLIRNQRHVITTKFPRHKLANDGTRFGVGQKIVTPKIIKAELVSQYRIDEFNGLVEDVASFKDHLIVERDPNNPNRLNVLWPPDLVNQLRIYAVLVQFRLQYNRGQDLEVIR